MFGIPRRRSGSRADTSRYALTNERTHTRTHARMHGHTHTQYDTARTPPLQDTTRTAHTLYTHTRCLSLLPNFPISVVFMTRQANLQIAVSSQTGDRELGIASAATGAQGSGKSPKASATAWTVEKVRVLSQIVCVLQVGSVCGVCVLPFRLK